MAAQSRRNGSHGNIVHGVDLVVALVLLAGCGVLYYVTTTFEEVSALLAQNIPPEFFPRLVLIFIALLAAALPFEHLLLARRGSDIDADRSERLPAMPYLTAALLVLIVVAIPYIGMLAAMFAVCLLLPRLWGERRWQIVVPFAIVFPLLVGFVFNRVLLVYLEPGLLGIGF
jgi:putative tricarboxylic transport membrane protein